jgi:hypothetical protein
VLNLGGHIFGHKLTIGTPLLDGEFDSLRRTFKRLLTIFALGVHLRQRRNLDSKCAVVLPYQQN